MFRGCMKAVCMKGGCKKGVCLGRAGRTMGKDCFQMNKFREKFQRFMIGRYGMDQLGQFIMRLVLVLIVVNIFVRAMVPSSILNILELAGLICLYFRMFSKNVGKRYQENQAYMHYSFYVNEYIRKVKFRFTEGRKYRIYKCPGCGQKVRIPRGHGKVSVHCPKCGMDFIKKS